MKRRFFSRLPTPRPGPLSRTHGNVTSIVSLSDLQGTFQEHHLSGDLSFSSEGHPIFTFYCLACGLYHAIQFPVGGMTSLAVEITDISEPE
jgi:hypothetical protein